MFHLLRFYSGEGKPTLLSRGEEGEVAGIELSVGKFEDVNFGEHMACIGYRTPEAYLPCVNRAIHTRQCPTCSARDVAKAYTVGDFSGYPELYKEAQKEEYCLYLAQFGEGITKCGVTRKERFQERMREQGSDFGCIIASFKGPDEIYNAESAVQSRFQFANAVRLAQKIRNLVFDKGAAHESIKSAVEMVRSSGVVPDFTPEIIDFSSHYPHVRHVQQTYSVLGTILGAKGEILIFRSEGGKEFCVNMRQQVGTFFEKK
ncbi:Uncharacterised protein [uncultured archaeon]|nr:Uncharacterised protein [uncultured archaeon]